MSRMGDYDLFNLEKSAAKRDESIARVGVNSEPFMPMALRALAALAAGEYTGEDIRRHLLVAGIKPHHPNAWGALIHAAVRKKMLVETGRWVRATSVKSHASRYPVYAKG